MFTLFSTRQPRTAEIEKMALGGRRTARECPRTFFRRKARRRAYRPDSGDIRGGGAMLKGKLMALERETAKRRPRKRRTLDIVVVQADGRETRRRVHDGDPGGGRDVLRFRIVHAEERPIESMTDDEVKNEIARLEAEARPRKGKRP